MFTAIDDNLGKIISSAAISLDIRYNNIEDMQFSADPNEIINYEEVLKKNNIKKIPVSYKKNHVRKYENGKNINVTQHFFIVNGKKLGVKHINESIYHKRIKNFIYGEMLNVASNFKFMYSNISNNNFNKQNYITMKTLYNAINLLDIRTITSGDLFEVSMKDVYNCKRADILLPFKKKHDVLGEGIVIEVQLSKQNNETTDKRTFDRAIKGYSVCWVDRSHFVDYKSDNLQIVKHPTLHSYLSVVSKYADNVQAKIYSDLQITKNKIIKACIEQCVGTECAHCKEHGNLGIMGLTKTGTWLVCSNKGKMLNNNICNNMLRIR